MTLDTSSASDPDINDSLTRLDDVEPLPPTAAEKRLFFSYKREDWAKVEPVKRALEADGQEIWIDTQGIPPGSEWPERVGVAIERSRAFVALVSKRFLASHNCQRELEEAVRVDKRIVPVVLEELDPESLPESIHIRNWIQEGDPEMIAMQIQEAIETDIEWLDEHARLYSAALRMEREGGRSYLLRGADLRQSARLLKRMESRTTPPRVGRRLRLLIRRSKQFRLRIIGVTVVGLLALGTFIWLYFLAERARTIGESLRIASESELRIDDQLDLAARLALISSSVDSNVDTESALLASLTSGPGLRGSHDLGVGVDAASLSDDGSIALIIDENGALHVVEKRGESISPLGMRGVSSVDALDRSIALAGTYEGSIVWLNPGQKSIESACDLPGQVDVATGNGVRAVAGIRGEGEARVVELDRSGCSLKEVATMTGVLGAADMDDAGNWAVGGSGGLSYSVGGTTGALSRGLTGWTAIDIEAETIWLGGGDGALYRVDVTAGSEPNRLLEAHDGAVTDIHLSEDSIITTGVDGFIRVWDRENGSMIAEMTGLLEDRLSAPLLALGMQDEDVATINAQGRFQRWVLNHGSPLAETLVSQQRVNSLTLSADEPVYVAGGIVADASGPLGIWPTAAGQATSVAADSSGTLYAGSSEGSVLVMQSNGWMELFQQDRPIQSITPVLEGRLAVVTADALHVLDVQSGEVERSVEGSYWSVADVGTDLIMAGMEDEGAILLFAGEEDPGMAFNVHRGTLDAIVPDASRRRIMTGGDDRVVRVWDMDTFGLVGSLVGHNERVLDITLNRDATKAVSIDEAGMMIVWDMTEMRQLGSSFRQPVKGLARSAYFTSDSTDTLYVAGPGLMRWGIGHDRLVAAACELADERQLTSAEAQQYLKGRSPDAPC